MHKAMITAISVGMMGCISQTAQTPITPSESIQPTSNVDSGIDHNAKLEELRKRYCEYEYDRDEVFCKKLKNLKIDKAKRNR